MTSVPDASRIRDEQWADRPDALRPVESPRSGFATSGGRPIGRRALLAGGAGAVALLAGACTQTTGTRRTVIVTTGAPPPPDPMGGLVAVTRLHTFRLAGAMAALAKDKTRLPVVTAVHADRESHLTALLAEWKRTNPTDAARAAAVPAQTVDVGTNATAIYGALSSDAANAQQQFTDALLYESRYRAALFASIVACLVTHQTVLK